MSMDNEPRNMAGVQYYAIERIEVGEYHEDLDGGGDPTEVHLLLTMEDHPHPFVMRFHSRPAVDDLIVALIAHSKAVWP